MKKLTFLTRLTLIAGLFLATASSAFAGWYNTSWTCRKAITIDHTKVSVDQSGFPVLINLASDAGLAAHARSDGFDLLFTSSDGTTVLPYEREKYTSATGELVAWVKAPTLSSTADTVLYLYYGNAAATDQQNTSNVWDSNYRGVWHLKENPRGTAPQMKDSAGGADNGTTGSGFAAGDQQSAKIDGGLHFGGAAAYDVSIANETNFDFQYNSSFSIEYWSKPTSGQTGKQNPVSKVQSTTTFPGYEVGHNFGGTPSGGIPTNVAGGVRIILVNKADGSASARRQIVVYRPGTKLNDGAWHHYVWTYNGNGHANGVILYEDGTPLPLTTDSEGDTLGANSMLNNVPVHIGMRENNTANWYNGLLDEVRISAAVRSAAWIQTEWTNQAAPSSFYSVGTEQSATTTTSLSRTSGGSPSIYGDSITFTATVSGGATPTGNVIFKDGATPLATNTLVNGQAAYITTMLDVSGSPHSIAAYYQGDSTHDTSDSSGNPVSQSVNKANPNVTAWPTASAIIYGQTLTNSTLSGGSATPAGSFAFTTPSTAPNAGSASQSVTYTPTDTANYNTASGLVSVTVNQANSSVAVESSANPSVQGSNVTFTATISPVSPAATTPTGNVQFYTNGIALGSTVALSGGVATLSMAGLPAGTNPVMAAYLGNGNFNGSTNSLAQVVTSNVETPSTLGIQDNGDGTVTVTFAGTPGAEYVVQAVSDLGAPSWQNVSTNTAGTDGQWTFTDSIAAPPVRFYRAAKP